MKKLNLNIGKSFKDKKFKYGGYATLMTAIVIAIVFAINLVATKLDLKADMTKNKLFSLSDQTNKVVDDLKQDVKIYGFYESGKENTMVTTVLDKYTGRSKKITVEFKDPVKYPTVTQQFKQSGTEPKSGSLVVQSGSKYKVIDQYDLVNYSTDEQGQSNVDSFAIEQRITSAIMYVTSEKNPVVYKLQGHDEASVGTEVTKQLGNENYEVKDLNLLTKDAAIEDDAILLISSPKKDLSQDEETKIRSFLSKGGKAIFLMQLLEDDLPRFQGILSSYGVGLNKAIIVEGSAQNVAGQNPIYLLPNLASHDILSPLQSKNIPVFVPGAQGIDTLSVKKASTTVEPLLTTSKNSWAKKNLKATTAEKETGDLTGPFNVAVAITDKIGDGTKNTKIVLVGNGNLTDSNVVTASAGNLDFLMNSFNWIQDKKDAITIRPKDVVSQNIQINGAEQLLFAGFVVIVIPVIVMIFGIVVWVRRRHR